MSTVKFRYKNQSDQPQALAGYGIVAPGQVIESDTPIENPNFVEIDNRRLVGVEAPVEQPKPNANSKKGKN